MRAATIVNTNAGGSWVVPLVGELARRHHDVVVFLADEPGGLAAKVEAVGARAEPMVALRPGAYRLPRRLRTLASTLRSFRPDLINYHLYRSAIVARTLSFLVPHAVRVHSVPGPLFLENRTIRVAERVLNRRDSLVHCTSKASAVLYRQLGVPAEKMIVVPYGVDTETLRPPSDEERLDARRDLGLAPDAFVVACVAYFYAPRRIALQGRAVKGHDVLFRAWREYKRTGGAGVLLVVGGGFGKDGEPYRREVLDLLTGVPGVEIVHNVEDVRRYYWASDVSVAASRSENLGSPAEASAMGVPWIATRAGGLPELVRARETGWLFEIDDHRELTALLHRVEAEAASGGLTPMRVTARALALEQLDQRANSRLMADTLERLVERRGR